LRENEAVRRLVRETRLSADSLIFPFFVREGNGVREDIPSLPGLTRYSPDTLPEGIEKALRAGVGRFLLFGIPARKDAEGSGAWAEGGVVQRAIRETRRRFPEALLISDVCLCEYTSHGHCGLVAGDRVDNDRTLPLIARTALSQAEAGADLVAPSDMMDGRVAAIRELLDRNGRETVPIMSYAVKYASAFYGPFREAADSAPGFGNRKGYQMDWHNLREAVREAKLDVREGADILIVKPAMGYLDVVSKVAETVEIPVAAYSVSGEYAMIRAAAEKGLLDCHAAMCESAAGVFRAGADILISYFAPELAAAIDKGDLG
jgi:porphobilinogen synthase